MSTQKSFNNVTNPFQVDRVVLAAVDDTQQQDTNLEPPFVRDRWASNGQLYIDCTNSSRLSNFNWVINTSTFLLNYQKVTRISLQYMSIPWYVNNINRRNYQISFTVGLNTYTASIARNNYLTPTTLATAIQLAFATSGAPGVWTVTALDNGCLNVSATVLFKFIASESLTRGLPCHGLAAFEFPTNSYTGGLAMLLETRYINITCPEIQQYTKMPNSGESVNSNTITRVYLHLVQPRIINVTYTAPLNVINWNRNAAITSLTFGLTDEFGEEPPLDDQSPAVFSPIFSFLCQT